MLRRTEEELSELKGRLLKKEKDLKKLERKKSHFDRKMDK